MKLTELRQMPKRVFSLHELSMWTGQSAKRLSVDLDRWFKSGELIRFKAGVYGLKPMHGDSWNTYSIARKLSQPSYVTDLTAMQHYSIPMEGVTAIISAHLSRPVWYQNEVGNFEFRRMVPSRFNGWIEHWGRDGVYWMATPEKAVLDYFYYRRKAWNPEWVEAELRPNISDCRFEKDKFLAQAEQYPGWVLTGAKSFLEVAET